MRAHFYCLVATFVLPVVSLANTIVVQNSSFETLPTGGLTDLISGQGAFSIGVLIPGWTSTNTDNSGEAQLLTGPSPSYPLYVADDGITSAWIREDTTLYQTVDAVVQLGVTYTLSVDIGWRNDKGTNGTADLLINGNTYMATGAPLTQGYWTTYTVSYTGIANDVGSPITIELNANSMAPNTQGNFDNVRLSDTASPEPAAGVLVGIVLIGLSLVRKGR